MTQRKKKFDWFDLLLKVAVVVAFIFIIVFAIWLRQVLPCDWMPLKEAPARCLTGVSR